MLDVRADDEAARLATELAAQHDLDFPSRGWNQGGDHDDSEALIKAETIRVNAKTTVQIEASSNIGMEGSSATKSTCSDNSNYDAPKIELE